MGVASIIFGIISIFSLGKGTSILFGLIGLVFGLCAKEPAEPTDEMYGCGTSKKKKTNEKIEYEKPGSAIFGIIICAIALILAFIPGLVIGALIRELMA